MLTEGLEPEVVKAFDDLSLEHQLTTVAVNVLERKVESLSKADQDDLLELLLTYVTCRKENDQEGLKSIHHALVEILNQVPMTARRMEMTGKTPMERGRKAWAEHVGRTVKQLRERAGMTQAELAERAGLTAQSHVSRIENAEYSATSLTLEKIAKALGVGVEAFDSRAAGSSK